MLSMSTGDNLTMQCNADAMQCMIVSLTKLKSQTYFSTVKNHRKIQNFSFLRIAEWLHGISAYFIILSLLKTNKVVEFLLQYVKNDMNQGYTIVKDSSADVGVNFKIVQNRPTIKAVCTKTSKFLFAYLEYFDISDRN